MSNWSSYFAYCLILGKVLLGLLGLAIVCQALTPTTYFTPADRDRLRRIFLAASGDDLETLYYSVVGVNLLDGDASDTSVSGYFQSFFLN